MFQPISTLNLPVDIPEVKHLSLKYVEDVKDFSSFQAHRDCLKAPETFTALDLLVKQENEDLVTSGIEGLDAALGGSFKSGGIYEFSGKNGTGKTQICFRICVNFLLENSKKEIYFVSTNSSFAISRIKELFTNSLKNTDDSDKQAQIQSNLNRIYVVDTSGITELLAALKNLEFWLENHEVGIVLIDSIFLPLKEVEHKDRKCLIFRILSDLQRLAFLHAFPVILTNNLTTRVMDEGVYYPSCLGENYYHRINSRIILRKLQGNYYQAKVEKSSNSKKTVVTFSID